MGFPVKAVVFDWAGTMVDFGCMAPVQALIAVFSGEGVTVTPTEVRRDMGMAKRDHLQALLKYPAVVSRWIAAKGAPPSEANIDRLFHKLVPAMKQAAADSAVLIPGAAETFAELRDLGVRIGSGTGYSREMMYEILRRAADQGYAPEAVVCAGETPSGRPSPFMTWKALMELNVWPARACIKVDDAPVGMEEGKQAGCWTIGVSGSGNGVGLDLKSYSALPPEERQQRVALATRELKAAGADYVVEDVSKLMPVVREIAERITVS